MQERVKVLLLHCVVVVLPVGLAGGALAGAMVGLTEAAWVAVMVPAQIAAPEEFQLFVWGPLVYAVLFSGGGLGIGGGVYFLAWLFRRSMSAERLFFISVGGSLAAGLLVIGRWRYARDVLEAGTPTLIESLLLVAAALIIGLAVERIGTWLVRRIQVGGIATCVFAVALFLGVVGVGAVLAAWLPQYPAGDDLVAHDIDGQTKPPAILPDTAPNIIFIVVDTLRADVLSCYSDDAPVHTRHFDQLAHDGILYTSCMAPSPWTKPTFATLFTGLRPDTHGALVAGSALPGSAITLAELLQDAGYYTQGFANNGHIHALYGFDKGFSEYVSLEPRLLLGARSSSRLLSLYELVRRIHAWVILRGIDITYFYQPANVVNKKVLEWLDGPARPTDAPFFLFLHYMDPHDPFLDPKKPDTGYALMDLGWFPPKSYLDRMLRAYHHGVKHTDKHLGVLLDALRERGLYDDALIVLTADHGEEFYEHGGWWHGETLYPEVLHVPLMIKAPGNRHAGSVEEGLVRHIDIPPTILHFLGLEQPEMMPGSTLVCAEGAPRDFSAPFAYASNFREGNLQRSVQTERYKLHMVEETVRRDMEPVKLFDLQADPLEQENLAGRNLPAEEELQTLLQELVEEMEAKALE